jgi:hypothetical protein
MQDLDCPGYSGKFLLKGTVQQDFLPPICSQMDSSQAPYSVFKDFSNLASKSRRYLQFLIDSSLLFIAESRYSPFCFSTESRDSPYHYSEGSLFVRIIYCT